MSRGRLDVTDLSRFAPRRLDVGSEEHMRVTDEASTAGAIVASTGDAAFAIDSGGRIVAWNQGAERLLGYDAASALGRACFTLLAGRDVFGNCYCNPHCPLLGMAMREEAVGPFEIDLRVASGGWLRTEVSLFAVPEDTAVAPRVVHVLRRSRRSDPGDKQLAAGDRFQRLTPREAEVLGLMANGMSTRDMAEALFVGEATVRHHVQSILRKLDVHSRLEAVAVLYHKESS